jgi:hypothetical protein
MEVWDAPHIVEHTRQALIVKLTRFRGHLNICV